MRDEGGDEATEAKIRDLEEAVCRDPGHLELRLALADYLEGAGRRTAAIEQIRQAIRLNPADPRNHERLGGLLLELGDLGGARSAFQEALRLFDGLRRVEAIMQELERALCALFPESHGYPSRHAEMAIQRTRAAVLHVPFELLALLEAGTRVQLAEVLRRQTRCREARTELNHALALLPSAGEQVERAMHAREPLAGYLEDRLLDSHKLLDEALPMLDQLREDIQAALRRLESEA